MKTTLLFSALMVMSLTACTFDVGSKADADPSTPTPSSPTASPPATPKAATSPVPATTTTPPAVSAAEETAKAEFAKTLAAGEKKWNLKNIVLNYLKRSGHQNGPVQEKLSTQCQSSRPVIVNGTYPHVSLMLGGITCGAKTPQEVTRLQFITGKMNYTARHIPAAGVPDQFRLDLQNVESGYFRWKETKGLNSLARKKDLGFDFFGVEKGRIDWTEENDFYLSISIQQSDDGRSEKLKISSNFDQSERTSFMKREYVEILFTADLERIP